MPSEPQELQNRLASLEKQLRHHRRWTLALLTLLGAAMAAAWVPGRRDRAIRARSITIEDEAGRDRMVIAAPVPDPREGERVSAVVGLVINDA
jgi:hypothetical protein